MYIKGQKVRLTKNPLDEQLGEYMQLKTYTIESVKDVRHMEGTSGQWVKTDKYNDWIDSSFFEPIDKSTIK